jgi:hypothetical protein
MRGLSTRVRLVVGVVLVTIGLVSIIVFPPGWKPSLAYLALGIVAGALCVSDIRLLALIGFGLLVFGARFVAERFGGSSPHLWWQPYVIVGAIMVIVYASALRIRRTRGGDRLTDTATASRT